MPIEGAVGGDCLEFLLRFRYYMRRGYGELCIETVSLRLISSLNPTTTARVSSMTISAKATPVYGNGDPCAPACAFRTGAAGGIFGNLTTWIVCSGFPLLSVI